jgi:hypothetical protein
LDLEAAVPSSRIPARIKISHYPSDGTGPTGVAKIHFRLSETLNPHSRDSSAHSNTRSPASRAFGGIRDKDQLRSGPGVDSSPSCRPMHFLLHHQWYEKERQTRPAEQILARKKGTGLETEFPSLWDDNTADKWHLYERASNISQRA